MGRSMSQCWVCNEPCTFTFCQKHIPKYGDVIKKENYTLFVGSMPLKKVLLAILGKEKITKWWLGTDALTMSEFPKGKKPLKIILHRIKMKLLDPFIYQHWLVSMRLLVYLRGRVNLSNFTIKVHDCYHMKKSKKPLIVGYYSPPFSKFNEWVYGIDIIEYFKRHFSKDNIVFLPYNGKTNIQPFLNAIDIYIRPSRSDGYPRLILLCQENKIPYMWSFTESFDPENKLKPISEFINFIKEKGNL
jgi:hypothetical protein